MLPDWGIAIHLGIVAHGLGAEAVLRGLAVSLDRRLMLARSDEQITWAWLSGRRRFDLCEVDSRLLRCDREQVVFSIGEPAEGMGGWRFTHRQAAAALPIALHRSGPLVHYRNVALLTAVIEDELLAASLRGLYLKPFERDRDGGDAARQTMRAYFEADRNVSSAAAALGVSRQTVTARLRAIEERLGNTLSRCAPDIEMALRLDELDAITSARRSS